MLQGHKSRGGLRADNIQVGQSGGILIITPSGVHVVICEILDCFAKRDF